jgi:Na+/H+ antiporter NhaB
MNIWPRYIRFSPTEFKIVADRLLGAPDCIAEALEIDISVVESITIHNLTKRVAVLWVQKGAAEALADTIEGSTYLIRARSAFEDGHLSRARYRMLKLAAISAAQKIRDAGIPCGDAPLY